MHLVEGGASRSLHCLCLSCVGREKVDVRRKGEMSPPPEAPFVTPPAPPPGPALSAHTFSFHMHTHGSNLELSSSSNANGSVTAHHRGETPTSGPLHVSFPSSSSNGYEASLIEATDYYAVVVHYTHAFAVSPFDDDRIDLSPPPRKLLLLLRVCSSFSSSLSLFLPPTVL